MPIRYGPIAAWLARATAHQLIHNNTPPTSTSAWLFADIRPIIEGGMDYSRIKRFSDFDFYETNGARKGTNRPVALDFVCLIEPHEGTGESEAYHLEGVGLTEVAVEWLIANRYIPAIYRDLLVTGGRDDLFADSNFLFWREHIYIAPPKTCPIQKPSPLQRTKHVKARTYTQAERIVALAEIAARTDIDARAKAAHKAHVTRRTVAA